jgi:hypothetical protein
MTASNWTSLSATSKGLRSRGEQLVSRRASETLMLTRISSRSVASAVAQRYLKRINEAALSHHVALQRVAVDLLSAIARSGFSHPITLSPTLAALTASDDPQLAAKAFSALALLHQKHTSILASRFLDSVRAIHAYILAGTAADAPVRGYRVNYEGVTESLLGRWYSLLQKEKRQIQLDCLKALARAFEVEVGSACPEVRFSLPQTTKSLDADVVSSRMRYLSPASSPKRFRVSTTSAPKNP